MEASAGSEIPADVSMRFSKSGALDGQTHPTIDVPDREVISSLMYAQVGTRPDIAFATNHLARFCEEPKLVHWRAMKRVLKYLKKTQGLYLNFKGSLQGVPECFVDSDFASDPDTRKSVSGYSVAISNLS